MTIGHDEALRVEKGSVRPEDIPAAPEPDDTTADVSGAPSPARPHVTPPTSSTPVPTSDPAATLRKADGISSSLADRLRVTRQHILRAHLAADYGARKLLSTVVGVRNGESPILGNQGRFSRDGDECIHDFREQLHAPGTRILAEIGFDWGQ